MKRVAVGELEGHRPSARIVGDEHQLRIDERAHLAVLGAEGLEIDRRVVQVVGEGGQAQGEERGQILFEAGEIEKPHPHSGAPHRLGEPFRVGRLVVEPIVLAALVVRASATNPAAAKSSG